MTLTTVYDNFAGMLVGETRNGAVHGYVPDSLGSLAGTVNSSGTMDSRIEYWPYGEEVNSTGSNPSPWSFVGLLGYFRDITSKLLYVRARHYTPLTAQWLTFDPLWPTHSTYGYSDQLPNFSVDPTGLGRVDVQCNKLAADCKACAKHIIDKLKHAKELIQPIAGFAVACMTGGTGLALGAGGKGLMVIVGASGSLGTGAVGIIFGDAVSTLEADLQAQCDAFAAACKSNADVRCFAIAMQQCGKLPPPADEDCFHRVYNGCMGMSKGKPNQPPLKKNPFEWVYRRCQGASFK